ncbi:sensor histidine kinase [Cryobacterium sp. PH31-L1]|uniref:sensor histidine kinase n=1 Tax=Cryobacterium sp. PH31-L1 TaxID=3046199 RepID=UPI0024B9A917|nr:sensor histidine kinase [Cryobacterium sp. PH31-L1]MDJ0376564.1 sensor histidine kinase [Cryobacterium sp. PH31-L1]
MPPHGESSGNGYGMPRPIRLWLPVVISVMIQVPAVAVLAWPGRGRFDHFDMMRGPGPLPDFERPGLALAGWFLAVGLALIGPLALIGARRFPGPVVAVVAVAAGSFTLVRPEIGVPYIALILAIVLGIVRGVRVWVYGSVAAAWVLVLGLAAAFGVGLHPLRIAGTTLALAVFMGIGEAIRSRRERFAELRRTLDARRMSAEQQERVRIARELHDVFAHSLSQINVQAGVGLHLIESQPEQAAQALASIKSTSKTALEEVRLVLGILRSGNEPGTAPLTPEPDLASLPALVETFRAQKLEVTLVDALEARSGDTEAEMPAATQLALYRICQEALTNVLRHARAGEASVVLASQNSDYLLTVTDDGLAPAWPLTSGGGLLGMRERAELLGGSLQVLRSARGGVQIAARIPMRRGER